MNDRESSLGNVSVVQIARAVASHELWEESRLEWAYGIMLMIFLMGSLSRCFSKRD